MSKVLLLDVVGLTPRALKHMPRLSRLGSTGAQVKLDTVLPAVTGTVQSSMLTGKLPRDHGAVANGWYFRELGDVLLWRQHNKLVTAPKVWETAREQVGEVTVANLCWWFAMGASSDITVTPRPIYHADGRKSPDAYIRPPALHDPMIERLGEFPLFQYWGPTASLHSSEWLINATRGVIAGEFGSSMPDLTMSYIPHLDYDLQRFGSSGIEADRAAAELDVALTPLLDEADALGMDIMVVSEYGIEDVNRPIHLNRMLREEGLLEVYVQEGREQLDPWTSRAFAVADHQVAHVYVDNAADHARVRALLESVPGVDEVLDRAQQAKYGLDHPRSGEFVVVAEPGAWFTYYFWLDDARAPEYARAVDIHRKPGYDPAELFFNPADKLAKAKAGLGLVKKHLGMRYAMQTVPLDASYVKGSHGRIPTNDLDAPVLLTSRDDLLADNTSSVAATGVHDLVLGLLTAKGQQ